MDKLKLHIGEKEEYLKELTYEINKKLAEVEVNPELPAGEKAYTFRKLKKEFQILKRNAIYKLF